MTTAPPPSPRKTRPVLTFVLLAAVVSAASQPTASSLALMGEWGLPDLAGRLILHTLPVLAIIPAVLIARFLGRGRTASVRWVIYAVIGFILGFLTPFCLDLLAGVPVALAALNGPLREPDALEAAFWSAGAVMMFLGAVLLAVAAFGARAAATFNMDELVDPEAHDIRRAERRAVGMSALGMAATGVALISLAVTRQSSEGAQLVPALVTLVSGAVSILASIILWRGFDELQRQLVVNAYAVSAIVVTSLTFCWAIAHAMGLVADMDSATVMGILILIQFVATSYASAKTGPYASQVTTS